MRDNAFLHILAKLPDYGWLRRFRRHSRPAPCRFGRRVNIRYATIAAEGRNTVDEGCKISGRLTLGYASTIGRYSCLSGMIHIGRYCQIAPSVGIYSKNHPINCLSTYMGSALFSGRMKQNCADGKVAIGNDVWIGHGAVVLPNVSIGDGAIVGAGAIVTRDVRDFAVVAGNPARCIRMRFPEDVANNLKRVPWWTCPPEELARLEEYFSMNLVNSHDAVLRLVEAWEERRPAPSRDRARILSA